MPILRDRVRALVDVFGESLAGDSMLLDRLDAWHRRLASAAPPAVVRYVGGG